MRGSSFRTRPCHVFAAVFLPLGVLAACTPPGTPVPGGRGSSLVGGWPFAPASIRVYPLTHVAPDAGAARIVTHVELRDRWGDSVKAPGTLAVLLYGSEGGRASAPEVQLMRWDIDLVDPQRNSGFYDPATRTYRFQLTGAPAWTATAARLVLQIEFRTMSFDGSETLLRDDYIIER